MKFQAVFQRKKGVSRDKKGVVPKTFFWRLCPQTPSLPVLSISQILGWIRSCFAGVQSIAIAHRRIQWGIQKDNREQKKLLAAHRRSRRKVPYSETGCFGPYALFMLREKHYHSSKTYLLVYEAPKKLAMTPSTDTDLQV